MFIFGKEVKAVTVTYDYNTNTVTDLTNGDIVLGQYPSNMGYDSESNGMDTIISTLFTNL